MQNCHCYFILVIRLTVYKRTTARFMADDKEDRMSSR